MANIKRDFIVMATLSATKDDIKTDVRELANIAIEDKVFAEQEQNLILNSSLQAI
jgi:hypothetical protein